MVTSKSASHVSSRRQVSSSSHHHSQSSTTTGQGQQQQQQQFQEQHSHHHHQQQQQQHQQVLLDRSNLPKSVDDKEILLHRLQAAESERSNLMGRIDDAESIMNNLQLKVNGGSGLENGGSNYQHYEESSSHSAHRAFATVTSTSGSSHDHASSGTPFTSASINAPFKPIHPDTGRDSLDRRAKVDRLLQKASSEAPSPVCDDSASTLTSTKKSSAAQSQAHFSTMSSVSSASTIGDRRPSSSMQQTQGGSHSHHAYEGHIDTYVQQQNAQNLNMSGSPSPSQRIQRTKSSSSRLNSDTMEGRARADLLTPAKSPRVIKKTVRARGGSVDNLHRGNEENVHREITKTVTYKPVPLQAHTIVINQCKEIIREAPKPRTPTPPPPKPQIVVVEAEKPPQKEMCIQTEDQKPLRKTSKTCDTQTEIQEGEIKENKHCLVAYALISFCATGAIILIYLFSVIK
jgi:hypothetical protein